MQDKPTSFSSAESPRSNGRRKTDFPKGTYPRCGSREHAAGNCPFKETICYYCQKAGHDQSVCLKRKNSQPVNIITKKFRTIKAISSTPLQQSVKIENPQQVHVKEENTMVYIYLNLNFRWLKHSGISFGSEQKHRALCRELIGDNLEVELAPFSFKLADGAASLSEGAAAEAAEVRKHRANDPKCSELGWVCIPLAVETYGNWGREAQSTFSRLASHLAIITSSHKSKVLTELYSRLNFTLVRAVARALLAKCAPSLGLQDIV
eukprot:Em0025g96a